MTQIVDLDPAKRDYPVSNRCPGCSKVKTVLVRRQDYHDWREGMLAQRAFPYLSADDREVLISGVCPQCWETMFG